MCELIATTIFIDWVDSLDVDEPCGGGVPGSALEPPRQKPRLTPRKLVTSEPAGTHTRRCAWDAPLRDPPGALKGIITEDRISEESDRLNDIGVNRPIKDELEVAAPKDIVELSLIHI